MRHQFAMESQIVQISQMKPKVCVLHCLKRMEIYKANTF